MLGGCSESEWQRFLKALSVGVLPLSNPHTGSSSLWSCLLHHRAGLSAAFVSLINRIDVHLRPEISAVRSPDRCLPVTPKRKYLPSFFFLSWSSSSASSDLLGQKWLDCSCHLIPTSATAWTLAQPRRGAWGRPAALVRSCHPRRGQ